MRLWLVASTYPTPRQPEGGAFVRHQARALAARGHDVVVIELAPAARSRRAGLLGASRWSENAPTGASTDAPTGVRVVRAQTAGGPLPGLRWLGRRAGARILQDVCDALGPPDLLHLHFTQMPGLAGTAFARRHGLPAVLTVHENEEWLRREMGVGACRRAWRDADVVVRVSGRDAHLLRRWSPDVRVVPNGFVERPSLPSKAEARAALGLEPDAHCAVAVGAFIPRKRQDLLVEALRRVRASGIDLRLLFVGVGPTRGHVERLVSDSGLGDSVRFLGRVSEPDLVLAYAAADVVCLASDAEGNPTVMFEAFGAGRPFVGTDVGGASEIVAAVGHGRVVPPGDAAALANALQEVLARLPAEAAVRAAASPYSWDAIAGRLEGIYAGLLRGGARR
ncbi:MAG: hypothetical protein QOJ26_950 [Thermoplasmata archaeon]|nr:hypothetical protein [Thermoplasmata archaeon]